MLFWCLFLPFCYVIVHVKSKREEMEREIIVEVIFVFFFLKYDRTFCMYNMHVKTTRDFSLNEILTFTTHHIIILTWEQTLWAHFSWCFTKHFFACKQLSKTSYNVVIFISILIIWVHDVQPVELYVRCIKKTPWHGLLNIL